ncbi:MAG TPA: Glu-tRNA(Gln) amidotransferase subunit GatE, partial [Candidatus Woesearchaeota archaeon]|nr:Glu-tRNA(Gln) amidotransferase subunit GatE [Candidatus Woesearchaeota archaeon]
MDYKKIGLKIGLELHEQLDTHKLFCKCPSILRDKIPDFEVRRKLKAVTGETGQKDIAAKSEELKDKLFIYEGYNDTTCLVELDDEPPHFINMEAMYIALQIAGLLHMKPFDEIQVMRKTVVDGSNTSGFQRTALVAENGFINKNGKIRVSSIALEEDAARRIENSGNEVRYRLDRLGIPLVELTTEADIHDPDQAKEAAEYLGLLMRMTCKVKRGIGTIRQDVNVSIKGGNRVEIKGFQALSEMPSLIRNEIERQQNLIQIGKKLRSRSSKLHTKFYDLKNIFKEADSNLIKKAIEQEWAITGIKLKGFAGLLSKQIVGEKTLAKDIVDYLKSFTGFNGFIHSDELPKYGISQKHLTQIMNLMYN